MCSRGGLQGGVGTEAASRALPIKGAAAAHLFSHVRPCVERVIPQRPEVWTSMRNLLF